MLKLPKKKKIIQQLHIPSYLPITVNPSKIMGQVDLNKDIDPQQGIDDLVVFGYIKPCALCTKGFSNKDIIMAPYGCNYHPWCCVTQN